MAVERRIAALPHKRIQSRLCGDFPRINVGDMFMRRHATHNAKIAFRSLNDDLNVQGGNILGVKCLPPYFYSSCPNWFLCYQL